MALKFFDDVSPTSGSLPFLDAFLQANPKLKQSQFEVVEIKKTRKGTGFLFITSHFSFFRWNNDKTTQRILDALKIYTTQENGYALFCCLTKKEDPLYQLAVDFDQKRIWYEGNGKYTQDATFLTMEQNDGDNPFLPPVP